MKFLWVVKLFLCAYGIFSHQNSLAVSVPKSQVPPVVVAEIKKLENQFDLALNQDCVSDKCFSRGCVYVSHETVDKPRSGSLPGLSEGEPGPGSVPAQEYLTAARCEFALEGSWSPKDTSILVKRLEQKLSRGYLVVSVEAKILPALPVSLKSTPMATPTPISTVTPAPSDPLETDVYPWHRLFNDLWRTMLPHWYWLTGLILAIIGFLVVLWAIRKLGKETALDRALAEAVAKETAESAQPLEVTQPEPKPSDKTNLNPQSFDLELTNEERELWTQRAQNQMSILAKTGSLMAEKGNSFEFCLLLKQLGIPLAKVLESEHWPQKIVQKAASSLPAGPQEIQEKKMITYLLEKNFLQAQFILSPTNYFERRLAEEVGPTDHALKPTSDSDNDELLVLAALWPILSLSEWIKMLSWPKKLNLAKQIISNTKVKRSLIQKVFEQNLKIEIEPQIKISLQQPKNLDNALVFSTLASACLPIQRNELAQSLEEAFPHQEPDWVQGIFIPQSLMLLEETHRNDLILGMEPDNMAAWFYGLPFSLRKSILEGLPEAAHKSLEKAAGSENTPDSAISVHRYWTGVRRVLSQTGILPTSKMLRNSP